MKIPLNLLLIVGVVFLLTSSHVYGGSAVTITSNQLIAKEYIIQLRNGAYPATLKRPHLRRHNKWKVKQSRREIIKAMDTAESLARAGKRHLIREPEYVFKGMSEEKLKAYRNKRAKKGRK